MLFYFTAQDDAIVCTKLELSLADVICALSFLYIVKEY